MWHAIISNKPYVKYQYHLTYMVAPVHSLLMNATLLLSIRTSSSVALELLLMVHLQVMISAQSDRYALPWLDIKCYNPLMKHFLEPVYCY